MSETRELIHEAAERLFEKHCGADTLRRARRGPRVPPPVRVTGDPLGIETGGHHAAGLVGVVAGEVGEPEVDARALRADC